MKKIAILMSALALTVFASCDKEPGVDLDNVIEEGFFVAGPATGSDELLAKNAMAAGFNEKTKENRTGMYEKYIVLEGGKDFYLLLNEGTTSTRYAATLETFNPGANAATNPVYTDNPNMNLQRGKLEVGKDNLVMKVEKTGLYHILLDLNLDKEAPLEEPQILVAPCDFSIRNNTLNQDYSMTASNEGDKYTWTWTGSMDKVTNFKFRYCLGWKVTLDADGEVKSETSFGIGDNKELTPRGGANINLGTGENITITLTYQNKPGDIHESFSYEITGVDKIEALDPATIGVGFAGAFGVEGDPTFWNAELPGNLKAVYVGTEGTKSTYKISNLALTAGQEFKLIVNGTWCGGTVTENAAACQYDGGGNMSLAADGNYDVVIELDYAVVDNVNTFTNIKITFTPVE